MKGRASKLQTLRPLGMPACTHKVCSPVLCHFFSNLFFQPSVCACVRACVGKRLIFGSIQSCQYILFDIFTFHSHVLNEIWRARKVFLKKKTEWGTSEFNQEQVLVEKVSPLGLHEQ